jgi:AcrR family transcriptional regulator
VTEADVTKDRILDAATEEFADHGFAGARIERIATRAGRNKQLIYHHFGNKSELHAAVILRVLAQQPAVAASTPEDLEVVLQTLMDDFATRETWWRMMLWESLETRGGQLVAEEPRREAMRARLAEAELLQAAGILEPRLPARLLLLAITGMMVLPFAMPQLVRLWCGTHPSDPGFRREYRAVVGEILRRLSSLGSAAPPPG